MREGGREGEGAVGEGNREGLREDGSDERREGEMEGVAGEDRKGVSEGGSERTMERRYSSATAFVRRSRASPNTLCVGTGPRRGGLRRRRVGDPDRRELVLRRRPARRRSRRWPGGHEPAGAAGQKQVLGRRYRRCGLPFPAPPLILHGQIDLPSVVFNMYV